MERRAPDDSEHDSEEDGDAAPTGRRETEAERIDRNLDELLQELRVATIGVQFLFGFLLALPFTVSFSQLDDSQRALYLVDLLLAVLAIALLIGPAAQHRLVFRQHKKADLLARANVMAIGGLVALGCAVAVAVLLVASVVTDGGVVVLVAGVTVVMIAGAWFLPAMLDRRRDDEY